MLFYILLFCVFVCNLSTDKAKKRKRIQTLIRQTARWTTASTQDNNPMIAVLHANYGAGYLWALKDVFSEDEIKKAVNIDLDRLKREVIQAQDIATKRMIQLCPKYGPKKSYLTFLGGEGL